MESEGVISNDEINGSELFLSLPLQDRQRKKIKKSLMYIIGVLYVIGQGKEQIYRKVLYFQTQIFL
jgi:predicted permease